MLRDDHKATEQRLKEEVWDRHNPDAPDYRQPSSNKPQAGRLSSLES